VEIPEKLVEAAARALCAEDSGEDPVTFDWNTILEYHREMYRETAHTVLEAALLECETRELIRVQYSEDGERQYTHGGLWDSRPASYHLSKLGEGKNLVLERRLVLECLFPPVVIQDEEVL